MQAATGEQAEVLVQGLGDAADVVGLVRLRVPVVGPVAGAGAAQIGNDDRTRTGEAGPGEPTQALLADQGEQVGVLGPPGRQP
ncbi:hypothetical protein [Streptomyces sp. NPDC057552]|uniref:hypothetical protein n=1 Tax=Streptomyces sp. NPDC057552 TaxID=3350537 RepID=UPI0036C15C53